MAKSDFCTLLLTCASRDEADKITNTLLVKHLVACVRQMPVTSNYRWHGKVEHEDEIMLIMESRLELFDLVEAEVARYHSYDTFVLEALPVDRVSAKAAKWLDSELK